MEDIFIFQAGFFKSGVKFGITISPELCLLGQNNTGTWAYVPL